MHHTLEKHRSFPLVAWILVICFAGLVLYLTSLLRGESSELETARANTLNAVERDLTTGRIEY